MRSDVKIGLVVGALLVIVVVAYVAIGPKEKKGEPIDTQANVQAEAPAPVNESAAAVPATEPAPVAEVTPTTAPAVPVIAIGGPTTVPAVSSPAEVSSPAAVSSPVAVASPGQGEYDWNRLLAGKQEASSVTAAPMDASAASVRPTASVAPVSAKVSAGKYVIKTGDTLSSIAAAQYGSVNQWKAILAANPGLKPNALRVGQTINLPAGAKAAAPVGAARKTSAAVGGNGKTYTVQPGDSLYKISIKLFGNPHHADEIYQLNKARIGSSPSHIRARMVLQVPAGAKVR